MIFLRLKGVLLFLLLLGLVEMGRAGTTATKAGLTSLTQFSSTSNDYRSPADEVESRSVYSAEHANQSALRFLKFNLFNVKGYDKAVRPVQNKTDILLVSIDFTYKQLLNLNEKEQTLTSLINYRLFWKDYFLSWEPEEYDGITDIWLPANTIWMPDVVCYEETGSRNFNPRIPFLVVHFDGTVRYLEPTAYQTSCEIKIAYFPFDVQTCTLTFASWTFPTSKLDLRARRSVENVRKDIDKYFVNSGEWDLIFIDTVKISESYFGGFTDFTSERNFTKQERDLITLQFYEMDPQSTVREATSLRISDRHWSNVKYTLKFRRNSSLHIQSMLFPALLLTTISVLGFYLPPESGERIGLQITILLTFMVFILTVGDMFPASTGPYLGVYFVLCMALLGLNIIMTVLVLHLHHIPCKLILIIDPMTGESKSNMKILPFWIKLGLLLTGVYQDLKKFAIPAVKLSQKSSAEGRMSALGNILRKWRSKTQTRRGQKKRVCPTIISNNCQVLSESENGARVLPGLIQDMENGRMQNLHKRVSTNRRVEKSNTFSESKGLDAKENPLNGFNEGLNCRRSTILLQDITKELTGMSKNLTALSSHFELSAWSTKNKNAEIVMEEKWKSVARKVDSHCMLAYISLMVIFHVVIALVVAFGA